MKIQPFMLPEDNIHKKKQRAPFIAPFALHFTSYLSLQTSAIITPMQLVVPIAVSAAVKMDITI